ncbi:tetratricopeptide repeat protein [Brassicibacter mesophilus]|uniref:tetratricopeptide repeat protein n=1 Tax=Brassicibacter mesophilus TaxID=745119 RepID=UPI003D19164C
MTIEKYIKQMRTSISDNKSYYEYKKIIFKYIEFLKNILVENPQNIKAVCQLAIMYMEAREPVEKSVELMEDTFNKFSDEINHDELAELLNNLAFFYAKEMYNIDKSKQLLVKAIEINTKIPNTYNALGMIFLNENNIIDALKMFSNATYLSKDIKYQNNYAVALYYAGQIDKAIEIFKNISKKWQNNEVAAKAYYSYGMSKSFLGDISTAIEVANSLHSRLDHKVYVDAYKIADLYYMCNEYKKCIELYDYEKLYPSADWLSIYFYSFQALNLKERLARVFNDIIIQKESDLKEAYIDNDESWTVEERKSYIEDLNKEIKDFADLYNSILVKRCKPCIDFKPELIYGCYLVDCPRHSN